MRPVSGLERPIVQWSFIAIAVTMMIATGATAVALRRAKTEASRLKGAVLQAALDKRQLELELSRERAARETLSRELSGLAGGRADLPPRITLAPLMKRSANAPAPTVDAQARDRLLEVRLDLPPRGAASAAYVVTMRGWSTGEVLWVRGGVAAVRTERGPAVVVRIAGDALTPGAYEFTVTTTTTGQQVEVASYEVAVAEPRR